MGYYNFPHTRNYDTDLGYLIDWFNKNKNKIEENTAITIEKALSASEDAIKAYNSATSASNSATSASNSAALALELKNQTEALKDLMQDKIDQINTNTSRIDNLATIDQGSITTTADAELVDIRVSYNGTTYPSAGDAVRGQISKLNSDLDKTNNLFITGNLMYFVDFANGYLSSDGMSVNYTADYKTSDFVSVESGKTITFTKCVRYAIYNADKSKTRVGNPSSESADTVTLALSDTEKFIRFTYPISASDIKMSYGNKLLDNVSVKGLFSKQYILVGNSEYCNFSNIQDAIDSITDDSPRKQYVIYLERGTYSKFNMITSPERARYISLIGLSGNNYDTVVFDDKGNYNNPPATILTNGSIKNISFVNRTSSDKKETGIQTYAFAVHDGANNDGSGSTNLLFENCYFYSNAGASYGCGLKENDVRKFINCKFETDNNAGCNTGLWQGAFYVHTNATKETNGQKLIMENCLLVCNSNIYAGSLQERTEYSSPLHFESRNCLYVGSDGANMYVQETIIPTLSFGNMPEALNTY